jgi:DNA-binding transcriptional ArsR family regulator
MQDEVLYRAIADPTRRQILDLLRDAGSMRAGDIAAQFGGADGISRNAVSKHLRVLREAELVHIDDSDDGRERRYALNPEPLQTMYGWLQRYEVFWQKRLDALRRLVEEDTKLPDEAN